MSGFFQNDLFTIPHFSFNLTSSVKSGHQTVIRSSHHQMFGIIRPSLCVIMLATPAAKRIHRQERPSVINPGIMILSITQHLIGGSYITQSPEIRHHRCGIRIEGHVLTLFCPHRIASDTHHQFVGSHFFDKPTGFSSLPGIDTSHPGIFISPEHTTRHLSEATANQSMYIIAGSQMGRITRQHIISGRFTETLCYIHIMPVG